MWKVFLWFFTLFLPSCWRNLPSITRMITPGLKWRKMLTLNCDQPLLRHFCVFPLSNHTANPGYLWLTWRLFVSIWWEKKSVLGIWNFRGIIAISLDTHIPPFHRRTCRIDWHLHTQLWSVSLLASSTLSRLKALGWISNAKSAFGQRSEEESQRTWWSLFFLKFFLSDISFQQLKVPLSSPLI